MKAFCVYPAPDPIEDGCCLVFAHNRNQERWYGLQGVPWFADYIDMRAYRVPNFDQYIIPGLAPYVITTNDELPDGAIEFFTECEV